MRRPTYGAPLAAAVASLDAVVGGSEHGAFAARLRIAALSLALCERDGRAFGTLNVDVDVPMAVKRMRALIAREVLGPVVPRHVLEAALHR